MYIYISETCKDCFNSEDSFLERYKATKGSCLKTGQHFIFVILYLLLLIKYIYLIPYQRYCLNFLCIKAKDLI